MTHYFAQESIRDDACLALKHNFLKVVKIPRIVMDISHNGDRKES